MIFFKILLLPNIALFSDFSQALYGYSQNSSMYIQVNVPRNGDHINPFYPSLVVSAPASYGDSNVKAHFFWLFMGLQDLQSPISCKWPVRFFIGIIALYAKKNRGDIERYVYTYVLTWICPLIIYFLVKSNNYLSKSALKSGEKYN